MGNGNNFCECKDKANIFEKLLQFPCKNSENSNSREININLSTHNSQKDFLINNKENLDITIESYYKNNAANKIIKNYREYRSRQNQASLHKYSKEEPTDLKVYPNLLNNGTLENNINYSNNNNNKYNSNDNLMLSNNSEKKQSMKILKRKPNNYIGSEINGKKEGFGIQIWDSESKYVGYHKNNKVHGIGRFTVGECVYEGEFENNECNGYGLYNHNGEIIFEGIWINDYQETIGIEKWEEGATYSGEFSKGKKQGIGCYEWSDGSKYEGEWHKNSLKGFGIYYYNDGRAYYGEWNNSMKDGFGEFCWKDKIYIGFYSQDKKEGFGIYYWKLANKAFLGFWKEGKQIGFGKFINGQKSKFGVWESEHPVKWFKNDKIAWDYLLKENLSNYKQFFLFTIDDVAQYCNRDEENNNGIESVKSF